MGGALRAIQKKSGSGEELPEPLLNYSENFHAPHQPAKGNYLNFTGASGNETSPISYQPTQGLKSAPFVPKL